MHEMLAQLFYRLMRDQGVTTEELLMHILECSPLPAQFSIESLGIIATSLATDFERVATREAV